MTTLIFGCIFATITLLAIGLQRTYYHYPLKELKRRARDGDVIAEMLYRPVSYGASLRALLWFIVIISASLTFVLLANALQPWFAVLLVGILIGLSFLWIPSSELTSVSIVLAKGLTPVINVLLYRLYPIIRRLLNVIQRFRHINFRTGLYEKEDLIDLLEFQRDLPENRISAQQIDMLQNVLWFSDKLVADIYVPLRIVHTVVESEPIGPKLMDDLYKSGFSRFPVYDDERKQITGTLYLKDLVKKQIKGSVRDVMRKEVFYVHEDFTLQQALGAFIKTKHHLFIVVNSFEEFAGIVTIEDILEQIIGQPIMDEFDKYEDMRAVAKRQADSEHASHDKAIQAKSEATTDGETDSKVIE